MNPLNTSLHSPTSDAGSDLGGGAPSDSDSSLKSTAQQTVQQVKQAAAETADRVKDQAAEMADRQRTGMADRIGAYSSAIHRSADALQDEDPNIAWLTHQLADRLSGAADYVRNRDFSQLREDAENFARRHPAVFFGGLFVGGLLVGNLLKASGRSLSEKATERDTYPRSENVPSADQPEQDPWPSGPRAESMP